MTLLRRLFRVVLAGLVFLAAYLFALAVVSAL